LVKSKSSPLLLLLLLLLLDGRPDAGRGDATPENVKPASAAARRLALATIRSAGVAPRREAPRGEKCMLSSGPSAMLSPNGTSVCAIVAARCPPLTSSPSWCAQSSARR
jgi:hypothetical protein